MINQLVPRKPFERFRHVLKGWRLVDVGNGAVRHFMAVPSFARVGLARLGGVQISYLGNLCRAAAMSFSVGGP